MNPPNTRRRFLDRSRHSGLLVESLEPRHLMAALNVGGITSGAISTNTEIDSYSFSGGAGEVIDLVVTSTPSSGNYLSFAQLFAPSGNRHTFFFSSDGTQRITLPFETGTYKLTISDAGQDGTGSYSIGTEGISPISPNPASLDFGGIVSGTISNPIEKDQLTFNAPALGIVDLVVTGQSQSSGFKPFMELFAPSGNRVAFWFSTDGTQRITLPEEEGTYTLMVQAAGLDATGSYSIGLEGINPISDDPLPLVMGGITTGTTFKAIEKDQFVFNADGPAVVDLVVTGTAKQGDFRPFMELFAPSGDRVAFWFANDGTQRLTLPDEQGKYMLMVQDTGLDAIGNYSIGFEGIQPFSPLPIPIIKGGITKGFTRTIEKDQLSFTATASSTIDLVLSSTATQGSYTAFAELFAPSGNRVTFWNATEGNQRITLPNESGTYVIMIQDLGEDGAGFYSLGFEGISPASPNPRSLLRNGVTTGQISTALEKDQLQFRALAGETIKLNVTSTAIDTGFVGFVELFSPAGDRVAFWRSNDGQVTLPLTGFGSGNYLLQVVALNLINRGDYSISFIGNPLPAAVAAPISLHTASSGTASVNLDWTDKSNNEVGFQIAVSYDGGESYVTVGTTTINDHTFTVTGLIPGQSYKMKVRAFTDSGVSPYSNVIDVTTKLNKPANLRASNVTATSLHLQWDDKSNNEARFDIFRRVGISGTFVKIGSATANTTSFVVSGLTKKTLYQFQVRAINSRSSSAFSNTLSVTTG
jgi:hypothetical protein